MDFTTPSRLASYSYAPAPNQNLTIRLGARAARALLPGPGSRAPRPLDWPGTRAHQTRGARHARTARTGAAAARAHTRGPPTPMGIGAPGCRPAAQRTLHRPAPASAGPATPRTRKARSRDPRRRPGAPARRPGMRTAPCPAPTAPDAGRAGSRRSAEDCRTKLATVHAPPGGRSAQGRGLRLRARSSRSHARRASAELRLSVEVQT